MSTSITTVQLDAAADALGVALRFEQRADVVLNGFFREEKKLGQRDRAFVADAVFDILRKLRTVARAAGAATGSRKLLLAWLVRCEGRSLRQLEELVSRGEREWLTTLKAEVTEPPSFAERCDMPDWLAARLRAQLGEEGALRLAESLNRAAPLDARVNPLKGDRDKVLAQLAAAGVEAAAGPFSPLAIRFVGKPGLQKHPLFVDGTLEVQDEGSQMLGLLLAPKRGEMVVDFCAGAGGKTLLLGALMRSTGRLYAFDVSEKRLARMKPRMARAGLSNVHPAVIAHENDARIKRLAGKADRVLVDAPCSGFGTLRRNPDMKWRQSEAGVAELVAKQTSILAAAAKLVKGGGRLVYATCSILQEENDGIVDAFLANHPDFIQISAAQVLAEQKIALDTGERLRINPLEHNTDGFFAAVLQKNKP